MIYHSLSFNGPKEWCHTCRNQYNVVCCDCTTFLYAFVTEQENAKIPNAISWRTQAHLIYVQMTIIIHITQGSFKVVEITASNDITNAVVMVH